MGLQGASTFDGVVMAMFPSSGRLSVELFDEHTMWPNFSMSMVTRMARLRELVRCYPHLGMDSSKRNYVFVH